MTESRAPSQLKEVTFEALYDAELDYVWTSLRRLGAREADLEDLTHEVFLTAYRRLADYDRSRPLRPWLFGIAMRIASDHRRKASTSREVHGEVPVVADPRSGPEEDAAAAQQRRLLSEALDTLSDELRAVFVMHAVNDHPVPEVAEALGVPLNTAYSRLRLARAALTTALQQLRDKEAGP